MKINSKQKKRSKDAQELRKCELYTHLKKLKDRERKRKRERETDRQTDRDRESERK